MSFSCLSTTDVNLVHHSFPTRNLIVVQVGNQAVKQISEYPCFRHSNVSSSVLDTLVWVQRLSRV